MNPNRVAVVAIGRNEGERLRKCLESVKGKTTLVVYVDSGSTDGSVAMARNSGYEVLELNLQTPFTAARARNEGFERVKQLAPDQPYVQFVDGDCEVVGGWLDAAVEFLDTHADIAAVCGRRRERHPEHSVYNLLCDIEWNVPTGDVKACGGDVMIRSEAFTRVNGFRRDLIAGEEPELCVRLRATGWRIWRLDREMTLHDAAMTRFSQWWQRSKRAGYTFAQGMALHGAPPEQHGVKASRRIWFWALGIPAAVAVMYLWLGPYALLMLLVYPLQVVRLAIRGRFSARMNWWHALFLVLGKFPEMLGQLKFWFDRYQGKQSHLIEYK